MPISRLLVVAALALCLFAAGCGTIFDKIGKQFSQIKLRRDVFAFTPATAAWAAAPQMPVDTPVDAGVVAPSGRLYLFPGLGSDITLRFDPALAAGVGAWELGPFLPEPRAGFEAVVVSRTVCIASGYGPSGAMGLVDMLDDAVVAPVWQRVVTPFRRAEAVVIGLPDRLLVVGGRDETGAVRTDVWELLGVTASATTLDWHKKGDLGLPRALATGFVLGRKVHVVGGHAGNGTPLASEDVYDLDTGTVTTTSAPVAVPTGRILPQAAVVGGRALVYDSRKVSGAVTGRLDSFTEAEGWTSRAPHPRPLNQPSIAGLGTGRLLTAGGSTSVSDYDSWSYDPPTDAWLKNGDIPARRSAGLLVEIGAKAYYCGGYEASLEDVEYEASDFLGF